jgi:hypothetical protein
VSTITSPCSGARADYGSDGRSGDPRPGDDGRVDVVRLHLPRDALLARGRTGLPDRCGAPVITVDQVLNHIRIARFRQAPRTRRSRWTALRRVVRRLVAPRAT